MMKGCRVEGETGEMIWGARLGGNLGVGDFGGDRASPDLVVRPMLSVGSVRHHELVRGRGLP